MVKVEFNKSLVNKCVSIRIIVPDNSSIYYRVCRFKISSMASRPTVFAIFTALMVSVYGCGVDSAVTHLQCDSDHECPDGSFCYQESQLCTRCVECGTYKRKSSWRSCPKTPTDCGACVPGFEEDILHEGKTRDMCVPSSVSPNSLSHTTAVAIHNGERFMWAGVIVILLLPIVLYAFFRNRERGMIHRGLPREEPPPYRSIELSTLSSNNNSVEQLAEEDVVLRIGQQKDTLVQAVPFRCPNYEDPHEFMTFDNFQDHISEGGESQTDGVSASVPPPVVELQDENTMPSDWTPASGHASSEQLMSFESGEVEELSGSDAEDSCVCEPVSKRRRADNDATNDNQPSDNCNTHLNINLFINNNVTIHKQS